AHRDVGEHDLHHRLAQRLPGGWRGVRGRPPAQLAIHLPAHPEQQQPARQREADDREQLQGDRGDAEDDRPPALPGRQTGDGQPDHDGIIAGQHDVDEQHLQEQGELDQQLLGNHPLPCQTEEARSRAIALTFPGKSMVPRYTRPEMAAIWSPENRYRIWFEIEAAAAEAMAALGSIPREAAAVIRERGAPALATIGPEDLARIDAIEAETRHDVIAFLTWLAEKIGPESRFVHQGMTSSDVLDTCLSVQLT